MPSRFLETFGLTALESLACRTPVIGFQKGWLTSFISDILALDRSEPISSLLSLLEREMNTSSEPIDVASYSQKSWTDKLSSLFGSTDQSILLLHDYREKIGGAEYYVSHVEEIFEALRYDVSRFWYEWKTTPWKRRWMVIFSLFAFHRGMRLAWLLKEKQPKIIWMHSVQRYIGYWWMRAVMKYTKTSGAKVYLSHHDVGLISPFPQYVTEESQIPRDTSFRVFISGLSPVKRCIAAIKWLYIKLLRSCFPANMEHIIFAPFLEKHIHLHFPNQKIHIFPHSYDETIFHP
jgi:glycosyltransferase involved in cell wall biosynthesis